MKRISTMLALSSFGLGIIFGGCKTSSEDSSELAGKGSKLTAVYECKLMVNDLLLDKLNGRLGSNGTLRIPNSPATNETVRWINQDNRNMSLGLNIVAFASSAYSGCNFVAAGGTCKNFTAKIQAPYQGTSLSVFYFEANGHFMLDHVIYRESSSTASAPIAFESSSGRAVTCTESAIPN